MAYDFTKDLTETADLIRRGEVTSVAVTDRHLKRIKEKDSKIGAFHTLNEKALEQAEKIDRKIAKGEMTGRLAGVPIGIKDVICTKGLLTTAGSLMLKNFLPPYSATLVERLESADAVILGKNSCDEFAMGSSNETSCFGPCRNPWDLDRVPGGSSGGSAASVSARMVLASIGTDTGGSIRQPSSFCGVVGIKPTYGRVSRYGIVGYASSLDQAGPIGLSVRDCALLLEEICGWDPRDSTTAPHPVENWSGLINSNLRSKRIGLLREFVSEIRDPEIIRGIQSAQDMLQTAGAEIVEVSVPLVTLAVPIYYIIACSEASSNLARYDGIRFGYSSIASGIEKQQLSLEDLYRRNRNKGFGDEVKRRIILGTFALSAGHHAAFFDKANRLRRMLAEEFAQAFKKCDIILAPTSDSLAFRVGERISDPLVMFRNDLFTTASSLVGLPCMSVPVGLSQEGMPMGIQLIAKSFDEQTLLNGASAIEEKVSFQNMRCPNV